MTEPAATPEVLAERERCASIAEDLAKHWEASAAKIRADGSYTVRALWPFGKKITCVRPGWERAARDVEAGVHGLRTVARLIKTGATRRSWTP